jgi:hypothetical protein
VKTGLYRKKTALQQMNSFLLYVGQRDEKEFKLPRKVVRYMHIYINMKQRLISEDY